MAWNNGKSGGSKSRVFNEFFTADKAFGCWRNFFHKLVFFQFKKSRQFQ
jgi:hypothetical protein